MDTRLLLDDTTLRMSRVGFGVLADDIDTLDDFFICNFFMIL